VAEPGERDALARLQATLADVLAAADPVAALHASRAAASGASAAGDVLARAHATALGAIDEDGLRVAALLVVKLRFQRLTNGSQHAHEWFARDPEGFTAAFRAYHRDVPPASLDPWGEAEAFERWLATRGVA
jgi:hypothetical protein